MSVSLRPQREAEILALVDRFGAVTRQHVEAAVFAGLKSAKRLAQDHLGRLVDEGRLRRLDGDTPVYIGARHPGHKLEHALALCDLWLSLRDHVESIEFEVRVPGGQVDALVRWQGREYWWEVERGRFDRFDLYHFDHRSRVLCLWTETPHELPPGVVGATGTFSEDPMALLQRAKEAVDGGAGVCVLRERAGGLGRGDDPRIAGQPPVGAPAGGLRVAGDPLDHPLPGDPRRLLGVRAGVRRPAERETAAVNLAGFDIWGGLR